MTNTDSIHTTLGLIGRFSYWSLEQKWQAHLDTYDAIADRNDQVRELYAVYGLAMYMACVFEQQALGALMLTRLHETEADSRERRDAYRMLSKKSLGQLLKILQPNITADQQVDRLLHIALRKRNHLAHSFWFIRVQGIEIDSVRRSAILECLRCAQLFEMADFVLEPMVRAWLKVHRIDDDRIDAIATRIKDTPPGKQFA